MQITEALRGAGLPMADAEVLLSSVLSKSRAWLLAHGNDALGPKDWTRFTTFVERRRKHEPVAYIVGEQEFYGRPFFVDNRVLIPRPSTEGVVHGALEFLKGNEEGIDDVDTGIVVTRKRIRPGVPKMIVDVGTGSGCIAITLALERPDVRVIASDVSEEALDVARKNAERHGVMQRVPLEPRNLLEGFESDEPFLLVSNPPYIPKESQLMPDVVKHEPHVALFGGEDGSDFARTLVEQARANPQCIGFVMECKRGQLPD